MTLSDFERRHYTVISRQMYSTQDR